MARSVTDRQQGAKGLLLFRSGGAWECKSQSVLQDETAHMAESKAKTPACLRFIHRGAIDAIAATSRERCRLETRHCNVVSTASAFIDSAGKR